MKQIYDDNKEYVDVTKDQAIDMIYKILYNSVLSGDVNSGEYIVISDDGIFIGDESDFDPDVLLYAIPVDGIVDFSKADEDSDFIDMSKIDFDKILSNL